MAESSSSSQPNDHVTIFSIILDRRNEGLQDDDYEQIETILNKCDVNARLKNCNNETLMHVAIREQNEKLIKLIYKNGGDFFVKNKLNQTPRDLAVELKLKKIIKFIDENEIIRFVNSEYFEENVTNENKRNIKAIKLSDECKFDEIFISHDDADNCQTFPNLFAFKILNKSVNKKILIDKISAQFNDGRPLFVYFQSEPSPYYYKRKSSFEFKAASAKMLEELQAIFNSTHIPISLIEKFCKFNDSLMIRILKIRKSIDNLKLTKSVIKLSENLDLFKAVIYEPFTLYRYDFIEIKQMIFCDRNKSVLELTIQFDRDDAVEYLIDNFKFYLRDLPFIVQKKLVDYIADKKMINYENTLYELIESDFPFPKNVDKIKDENIQKIIKDREIFKTNDLEDIKEYVNENELMKIGYDSKNKSALLCAIESKNFDTYSYLLSVGFRTDNAHKLKQKIDELSDEDKEKIAFKNAKHAHSDDKNHLRLLTNRFGIFGYYENKEQHKVYFDKIIKVLEELNGIERCKPLLRFCADVEILKVTLDFENEDISEVDPSSSGVGVTYSSGLIFGAAKQSHDEVKKTIIHELCHFAMRQFYENNSRPYYLNDQVNSKKFEEITKKILNFVKIKKGDCVDGILTAIEQGYSPEKYQNEMIVRAFEIFVHFDKRENKMRNLPKCYAQLIDFVDEHVVKALSSEELKNRIKIRNFNAYIGLLQNIREANKRLIISENSSNDAKLLEILQNSQKNYLIVSNVPKLALINIKSYLNSIQKSLYDAKNIFLDPAQLGNKKKLEDFKKLHKIMSTVIIADISNGCEKNYYSQERKFIFITSKSKLNESELFLGKYYFSYDKIEINYEWKDLSKESQERLVEKVNFQGKELKLGEIINEDLINENIIDENVFVDLFNEGQIIKINFEIDQCEVFVERQFNKVVEKKEEEAEVIAVPETSNSKNKHPFQMVLARHREKLNKQERVEENFAVSHLDFVNKVENVAKILISDIAGSGKSYILKKISYLLMSKCDSHDNYWVLFIDLRKFLNEFDKWKNQKCFLNFFNDHFGRNLKSYEKKIFEILYKCGKVKILFDGFDEISPKCKDIVIEFIKSIDLKANNSNNPSSSTSELVEFHNQLWITTRKHLEFELQDRLEISEIFSLKSLETDEEMTKFLIAYWKSKDIQLNSVNNLNKLAKQVIVKFREIKLDDSNLIGKIQQLKILAEICIQNDEIKVESLSNFTMYDIYEKSIDQFIVNWKKRPDCKELVKNVDWGLSPNFIVNHQHRAMLESIDKEIATKFFSNFSKMWSLEELEKGGLVTFENDKVYFIHTTYLEFFIANFMMQSLKNSAFISELLIELFCDIMFVPYLTTTQMFVNDKINSLNLSEDQIAMFTEYFSTKLIDFNILEQSVKQNHENVFKFLLKIIKNVDDNKRKLILASEPEYPLYLSLRDSKINVFTEILKVTTEYLTDDEFYELMKKKINKYTLLQLFFIDNVTSEMMNSLISTIKNINEDIIKKLLLCKGGDYNSLSIQMLLIETNSENLDKFEYFFNYHFNYMSLEELIENSVNDNGDNILHYIARNLNMFVHEKLWERCKIEFQSNKSKLNQLLDKRNKYNNNFLHQLVCIEKSSVEILKFNLTEIEKICEMKEFLLCRCQSWNGLSIQMLLLKTNTDNLDKFEYFFNYHLKYMNLEELIENSVDDNGDNILHYIARNLNMFVHEKLWERCKSEFQSNKSKLNQLLDKRNKYNNNFLHQLVCIEKSSVEILKFNLTEIEKICEMKEFLLCRCQSWNGLSIQMLLLKTNTDNLDKFEYFFNYHLKYMNLEELIENSVDDNGDNILHYIARNLNMFVHEKLWERCKSEFQSNKSKLNQLLDKRNKYNNNFLHQLVCIEKSSVEILKFNLTEIKKICEIKDFLLCRGHPWNGLSIQMLLNATNTDNLDKFEYFFSYHFKYMSLEELIENSDDDNGHNILHYIAFNLNMFVHEKLWERCKSEFQSNKSKLNQLLDKRNKYNNNFLHQLVCIEKSSVEILKFNLTEIEKICEVKDFLLCRCQSWNGLSIQMLLLKTNTDNLDKFEYFFNYHLKYMNLEELIENSVDDNGDNILHYIARNLNMFVHEKLWERCKSEFQSNKSKLNQLLDKRNKYNNNFLHQLVCIEKSSVEILKFNLTEIEKICEMKEFLLCRCQSWNGLSIQMLLLKTNTDNLDKFEYFFNYHLKYMNLEELIENSVDDNGDNILHYIARNLNMFVHEKLWERCKSEFQSNKSKLNQLLDKRNKYNNNFLHQLVCIEKSSVEILKFNLTEIEKICEMKEFLLCRCQSWNGLSIQMLLLKTNTDNLDKFEYFFNYHLKYMNLEELIENSVDDNGDNILHYIARNLNMFVHEKLWERCKSEFQSNKSKLNQLLDKRNKYNNNFLHQLVCIEKSSVEILKFNLTEIEKICEIKDFLLCRGHPWNGLSIQMLLNATNTDNLDKFEYFFSYHFKYMSLEELIENSDDDNGHNILHYIAFNLNMFVHEKLWERCKSEFQSNKSKLNQLLDKRNKYNNNFLHQLVCIEKSSVEILKFNLTEIEKICEVKDFLLCRCQSWNGLSIQMLLSNTNADNLDKFEYFFNYHFKYISLEELIENSVNDNGSNILHYIAWNLNMFVHEKLWERCKIEFQSNKSKLNQLLDKRNKYNNNFLHQLVCIEKSSVEILKFNLTEIEKICEMKEFLLCRCQSWNGLSIQMLLLETNTDNLDKFENFFNYHFKYISLEELIENSVNDNGDNILHYIAWNLNMFVHEKLWERCKIEFKSNKSKLNQLLDKRNKFNRNFLHELVCIEKSSVEILKFNLTEIEKICEVKDFLLLRGESWNGLSIQMLLSNTNNDNLDKFEYFFNYHFKYMSLEELIENSVNDNGNNILHYIACNLNMFVHEILWERCKIEFDSNKSKLNQLLDKRNKFNRNFLHELVCIEKSSVEILKFNLTEIEKSCEMKDFLLCRGESWNGLSIQMLLSNTNNDNLDKFEYFFNYHFKYMSLEELIENSVNDNGNNILHYIACNLNMFVHEKLWERCKIEFQSNKSKLNQLLDKRNKYNNNFLHRLVCTEKSSVEILKFNLTEITKFFNNSFEICSSKGQNDNTLLQIALIRKQSFDFFVILWKFIKDSCSRDNFIKHINELNSDKMNIFHVALNMTNEETHSKIRFFEYIIDSLKNDLKMSQSEMKSFLRLLISSQIKNNILIFIAKNVTSVKIHEYLWRVFENLFDANEILDLINEVDLDGFNLLGIVVASNIEKNLNVVEYTWNKIKTYLKTTDEQKRHVEKCEILLDRFPNEKWLNELFIYYKIDLSTHKYAKRQKN